MIWSQAYIYRWMTSIFYISIYYLAVVLCVDYFLPSLSILYSILAIRNIISYKIYVIWQISTIDASLRWNSMVNFFNSWSSLIATIRNSTKNLLIEFVKLYITYRVKCVCKNFYFQTMFLAWKIVQIRLHSLYIINVPNKSISL